ncbi:J domain-containing protein [Aurantiacibacter flavus]|uniref:J domain-containing protein n=1 Tax=Aurantiacibacter flavus TaxID=3145232 RepID=A0ABV0CYY1_9SPHN
MRQTKFHGRIEDSARSCDYPGCEEPGEFRAPGSRGHGFDGPGDYRWFCLQHVREFNAGYDWFDGMSADEIYEAQAPAAGWRRESPSFRGAAHFATPRWADFEDPLDAIGARAEGIRNAARARGERAQAEAARAVRFSAREREALQVMGLTQEADKPQLRRRYSELVRRYHPDRNGGDRSHENRLQRVVEAYQVLRRANGFS